MLKIKDLVTEFQGKNRPVCVLDKVSFDISPGEILALVGESGSGKSMTAFSIMRLLPDSASVTSGTVTVEGNELMGLPESMMRHFRSSKVSLIFQEPATSLNPVMTIGNQILETIYLHTSLRGEEAQEDAVQWLEKVGIADPRKRFDMFPHELSGGQKQRAMIAMALAAKPQYLIADEPTTALDVTIQAKILDLLKKLRETENIGILLITHDLAVVAQVADKVGLMYAGQLVELASAKDFFSRPLHPYARSLLKALPDGKTKKSELEAIAGMVPPLDSEFKGCRFANRCPQAQKDCFNSVVELNAVMTRQVRCLFPQNYSVSLPWHSRNFNNPKGEFPIVLSVKDYSIGFPVRGRFLQKQQYFNAVNHVSFNVRKGLTTAIVGESGSGKTTVARGILQLLRGQAKIGGMACLGSADLSTLRGKDLLHARRRIQVIFQDPYSSLNPRMRVREILLEGLKSLCPETPEKQAEAEAVQMLNKCGLPSEAMFRYPHEFSGGQRQRLAIARALVVKPEILICDEPTSALDVSVQAQILNLLNKIQREQGISYLFITHNFGVVKYMADEIIVMKKGEVVEQGSAQEILLNPRHPYTQGLLNSVPNFEVINQTKLP